jgi:hypothetical protein
MKAYSLTLVALASSFFISGCAMNRAASERMLNERAEYDAGSGPELALKEAGLDGYRNSPTPIRTRARVAAAYLHPQATANPDFYFWGGWVSIVVERDEWVLKRLARMPKAPGIIDVTPAKKNQKGAPAPKK